MNLSLNDPAADEFMSQLEEDTQIEIKYFLYNLFIKRYRKYFYFRDYQSKINDRIPAYFDDRDQDYRVFFDGVLKLLEPVNLTKNQIIMDESDEVL